MTPSAENTVYEFTDISKLAIQVVKEHSEIREELKNYFKDYQNIEKPETEAKKLNQNYYVSLITTFIIQCIIAITILAILLLVRKHLKIQKKRRKRRK